MEQGTTELGTKVNGNAVATTLAADWGLDDAVRSELIIIPKMLCMQKTSKLCDDEASEIRPGFLVDSVSHKVLTEKDASVEVVPLTFNETWELYDISGGTPKWVGSEPLTAANASSPWLYDEDGQKFRRDMTINMFVLLKSEVLAAADPKASPVDGLFPYQISFSRTSHRAGKVIATQFALAQQLGQPAARYVFAISTEKKSGDDNTWYVFNAKKVGILTDAELGECREWYKTIKAGKNIKVDDSEHEHVVRHDIGDITGAPEF